MLATPVLSTLRRELPQAEIDIALEAWVAPLLEGLEGVGIQSIGADAAARLRAAARLKKRRYDAVINLHGGSTSSTLTAATLAKYRLGFSHYRFPRTYTHLYGSPADLWGTTELHSVEQQLAILALAGIEVDLAAPTTLPVNAAAEAAVSSRVAAKGPLALLHPAAAYETKQWPAANFARVAEHLASLGFHVAAVAARNETETLASVRQAANCVIQAFDDLTLPEVTALARRADVFVGNDSGIAHIAAAVGTPSVVIFGSSNRVHWRPWTQARHEIVFEEFACQPCPGDRCREFGEPRCILDIPVTNVINALDRITAAAGTRTPPSASI